MRDCCICCSMVQKKKTGHKQDRITTQQRSMSTDRQVLLSEWEHHECEREKHGASVLRPEEEEVEFVLVPFDENRHDFDDQILDGDKAFVKEKVVKKKRADVRQCLSRVVVLSASDVRQIFGGFVQWWGVEVVGGEERTPVCENQHQSARTITNDARSLSDETALSTERSKAVSVFKHDRATEERESGLKLLKKQGEERLMQERETILFLLQPKHSTESLKDKRSLLWERLYSIHAALLPKDEVNVQSCWPFACSRPYEETYISLLGAVKIKWSRLKEHRCSRLLSFLLSHCDVTSVK